MNPKQRKQQLSQILKDKRDMETYQKNKQKYLNDNINSGIETGKTLYDGIKKLRNQYPTNSSAISAGINSNISNSNIGNNAISGAINSNIVGNNSAGSAVGNAIGTQVGGANASQVTGALSKAGGLMQNASKAMPVVGAVTGGLSAANNFANGKSADGALDLAKTGAMFIPGVGWAVAGAIQIAQMLKGAKEKAEQKAIAKSQEEAAKSQQLSIQNINDTKNGLEQQRQENLANMQEQSQQSDANADLVNDLIAQYNDYDSEQGIPTGGAANIGMPTNYKEENALALPYEGSATQGLTEANNNNASKVQSILEGLKSIGGKIGEGITDFSEGYQDNATNGFAKGDLFNQIRSNNNEVTPMQTQEGVMTGGANTVDKSILNRVGEAFGTGARIMSNPWTQAGIAALATKATGGDWADSLNNAYKYGTAKATSNFYNNKMNPGKAPNALQNYTKDDYAAETLAKYRDTMSDNNAKRVDYQAYAKKSKEFSDMLKYGMISPEQYTNAMRMLNDNFGEENYAVGVESAQESNDTKRMYETGRHNHVAEGIQQQNANTGAKRLEETVSHNRNSESLGKKNYDLNVEKWNAKQASDKQKQIEKQVENGELIRCTINGQSGYLTPLQFKEAKKKYGRGVSRL